MTDVQTLERDITAAISGAADEATLEQVRVSALGKKGSISELLKTLGGMSPEERKEKGPQFNTLRDRIGEAIATRKAQLQEQALNARLASGRVDVTLPGPPGPQRSAEHTPEL